MYNRIRSYTAVDPYRVSWNIDTESTKADNGSGFCSGPYDRTSQSSTTTLIPRRYNRGVISDYIVLPKVHHKKNGKRSGMLPRAVKPVHHVKVSIDKIKDVGANLAPSTGDTTFTQFSSSSDELCDYSAQILQTCPPMAFLCARFGYDFVKAQILDKLPQAVTSEFGTAEWSDIMDSFDEATKELVPSRFFSGESVAEGAIYFDAIRLVTNPARSITHFIKDVRKRGLHRLRLGELNRYYLKLLNRKTYRETEESIKLARALELTRFGIQEGINTHLTYQFGVLPAIQDVGATLRAHSTVERALGFLNNHRGRYVPIRTRRRLNATFTTGTFTSPYLDFASVLKDAYSIFSVFGQGRVRADINEASKFRAYMEYFGINKAIGTAWELIPFSFVADWFTNSQEAINHLTRIPLGESPFMNIAAVGHSVKNCEVYDYVVNPGYDLAYGWPHMSPDSQFPCFSYTVTDYTRTPGFPDTSWFADLSNFGSFQYITGGELLFQKYL